MESKKERLLEHYPEPSDKEIVNYYFDVIESVLKNYKKKETVFLDPYKVKIIESIANIYVDVNVLTYGGFKESERKKALIAPGAWNINKDLLGINIISIKGNFEFDPPTHRDVLGSLMGLGIKREMIGDIIVGNEVINVAVDEKITDYLLQNLYRIKRTSVSLDIVNTQEITTVEDYLKEIKGTVASLRLDSVASVGFSSSRNKMKELIKAQRVKLNWKPTFDPKVEINEGDIISLKGMGRIEIMEVGKKSKKGRRHVTVRRYK